MIYSVAIISKSGKPLLARQYQSLSRVEVETLLNNFPKLLGTSGKDEENELKKERANEQQHTFVETDRVRYVYSPLKTMFLVLITTKDSNIIEDLDTLAMLTRVVKSEVEDLSEDSVLTAAFEIMMAFDELVSMGYKESMSFDQIQSSLSMESHEENLHNLILQSKIDEAQQTGRRVAKELAEKKRNFKKKGMTGDEFRTGVSSHGTKSGFSFSPMDSDITQSHVGSYQTDDQDYSSSTSKSTSISKFAPKNMKLKSNKKRVQKSFIQEMVDVGEVEQEDQPQDKPEEDKIVTKTDAVSVSIEELISVGLNKEGGLVEIDVKGEMFLTINHPERTEIKLQLGDATDRENFKFKTHPNIEKSSFRKENILELKQSKKGFPQGVSLKILTWKLDGEKDACLPIQVSCWPSESESGSSVTVEYELLKENFTLRDVKILIPIPSSNVEVTNIEQGTYKINRDDNALLWRIDQLSSENPEGQIEFEVNTSSHQESSFFPLEVLFNTDQLLSGISVEKCIKGEENVDFASAATLKTDDFIVS